MRGSVSGAILLGLIHLAGSSQAALPQDAASQPPRLRVCCALGYDLDLRLGTLFAPVAVQNVVQAEHLGQHRYAAHSIFDERNGLVLTCDGGFIDVGHLRSAADLVAHIFARLRARGPRAGAVRFELSDGPATLQLHRGLNDDAERLLIAQRAAYALTVWHEIATGTGQDTISIFSEAFSAFSPEDLYSDLLGTWVGAQSVLDARPYDEAAQRWTQALLQTLGAQGLTSTRHGLDQVEGDWWRKDVPLPNAHLLKRRNFSFEPPLLPWQVPRPAQVGCPTVRPHLAELPTTLPNGQPAQDVYELQLQRAPPHGARSSTVTPSQFADLVTQAAARLAQTPTPEPTASELAGIHIMALRGFGGIGASWGARARGGLQVVGAQASGSGGDLSLIRFAAAYDPGPQGLSAHFTGIQARNLFFCTERGGDRTHPPIAAWFQDCEPTGFFGVGGTLAQFQHDGDTGRWVMRPVEAHLSFALLENAFSEGFLDGHLVLQTGLAVENAQQPGIESNLSVRARTQLQGQLQSQDQRWQGQAWAALHRDLLDATDEGVELGAELQHRLILRESTSRGPSPVWGVVQLGLQVGYTYWSQPSAALDDMLLPVTSATEPHGLRALLTVGFTLDRWVF